MLGLFAIASSAFALGKQEVADILLEEYPGANITDIARETYRGTRVFEIDFEYEGEKLEAIIGLDGKIIKVQIDE